MTGLARDGNIERLIVASDYYSKLADRPERRRERERFPTTDNRTYKVAAIQSLAEHSGK